MVLDHVVILSGPLEHEIARFSALGFVVQRGGSHPRWGTENALLVLGDGTYLEFLALRDEAAGTHRLWRRPDGTLRPRGTFSAFALGVTDLAAAVARLRRAGIPCSEPETGGRLRPDGRRLTWRLAFSTLPGLPFLIEDITPRHDRVPPPPPGSLNAACTLTGITVTSQERDRVVQAYAALLDRSPGCSPAQADAVRLETVTIVLRASANPATEGDVEEVALGIPASAAAVLPLVRSSDGIVIDPEASGGLRLRVTTS